MRLAEAKNSQNPPRVEDVSSPITQKMNVKKSNINVAGIVAANHRKCGIEYLFFHRIHLHQLHTTFVVKLC